MDRNGTAGGGLLAWMVVTKPKRVTTALGNEPKEVWLGRGAVRIGAGARV